jgi:hypothetical protein
VSLFIAASDETAPGDSRKTGTFVYGGYVASLDNWREFNKAWAKYVIGKKTPDFVLHMSELRNRKKREKAGISNKVAKRKIDGAFKVVRDAKDVRPVVSFMSTAVFSTTLSSLTLKRPGRRATALLPDHVAFYRYVRTVTSIVSELHAEARRINFMIESKSRDLTRDFEDIFDLVRQELSDEGATTEAALLGCLYSETKQRPALQAADMAIWLVRGAKDKKKLLRSEKRKAIRSFNARGKYWEMNDPAVEQNARRLAALAQLSSAASGSRPLCPDPADSI